MPVEAQYMIAFHRANDIRLRRQFLRREVHKPLMRDSMDTLAYYLRSPLEPALHNLELWSILQWVWHMPYKNKDYLIRLTEASEYRTLGQLTQRQMSILRGYLLK